MSVYFTDNGPLCIGFRSLTEGRKTEKQIEGEGGEAEAEEEEEEEEEEEGEEEEETGGKTHKHPPKEMYAVVP